MTKVSSNTQNDDLKAFGIAVKRARSLNTWTLDELGGRFEPPVGKSFISKIEKGRKETLNARTVGRFIKALDMNNTWIDKFLDTDTEDEGDETKVEQDADRIFDRVTREEQTQGASEELLIQLANSYAEGQHRDVETAYVGVKNALIAFARMQQQGEAGGNADDQFQAVMAEVAELNDLGELDQADALLASEEKRMFAAHQAESERQDEAKRQMLDQRLGQDRLRNDPEAAAQRLIRNLRQTPQPGGLFWAINAKVVEWIDDGDKAGDIFALQVALGLAKANYERAKTKKGLAAAALYSLGGCYMRLAERSPNDRHFFVACNAFAAAIEKTSKSKDPENWAVRQDGLGAAIGQLGARVADPEMLLQAVKAHRAALKVNITQKSDSQKISWNNLGGALRNLGEVTRQVDTLIEAISTLETALALKDRQADAVNWAAMQSNFALAQRWLGDVTDDLNMLTTARKSFAGCEALDYRETAPFQWAMLQWNIADLALTRYRLDPDPVLLADARSHVGTARAFFVEGSDYQTQRCDDLLAKIALAEA